jgi:hypothetical protein
MGRFLYLKWVDLSGIPETGQLKKPKPSEKDGPDLIACKPMEN